MKRLLLGLFLFSGSALACDKIDYVEVKDWPLEQVEKALCDSAEEAYKLTSRSVALMGSKYVDWQQYEPAIEACMKQNALYYRVIENVHKRKPPVCKYKLR